MFKNILKVLSGSLLSSLMLCSVNSEDNNVDYGVSEHSSDYYEFGLDGYYIDGSSEAFVSDFSSGYKRFDVNYSGNSNEVLVLKYRVDYNVLGDFNFLFYWNNMTNDGNSYFWVENNSSYIPNNEIVNAIEYGTGIGEYGGCIGDCYKYTISADSITSGYINICIPLELCGSSSFITGIEDFEVDYNELKELSKTNIRSGLTNINYNVDGLNLKNVDFNYENLSDYSNFCINGNLSFNVSSLYCESNKNNSYYQLTLDGLVVGEKYSLNYNTIFNTNNIRSDNAKYKILIENCENSFNGINNLFNNVSNSNTLINKTFYGTDGKGDFNFVASSSKINLIIFFGENEEVKLEKNVLLNLKINKYVEEVKEKELKRLELNSIDDFYYFNNNKGKNCHYNFIENSVLNNSGVMAYQKKFDLGLNYIYNQLIIDSLEVGKTYKIEYSVLKDEFSDKKKGTTILFSDGDRKFSEWENLKSVNNYTKYGNVYNLSNYDCGTSVDNEKHIVEFVATSEYLNILVSNGYNTSSSVGDVFELAFNVYECNVLDNSSSSGSTTDKDNSSNSGSTTDKDNSSNSGSTTDKDNSSNSGSTTDKDNSSNSGSTTDKDNSSNNDSSTSVWTKIFKTIWNWIVKLIQWIISLFTK